MMEKKTIVLNNVRFLPRQYMETYFARELLLLGYKEFPKPYHNRLNHYEVCRTRFVSWRHTLLIKQYVPFFNFNQRNNYVLKARIVS